MHRREIVPEAMDGPGLAPEEHRAALRGLARLNRFSRVATVMYGNLRRLSALSPRPLRVLDVATGSGDLPLFWLRRARREGLPLQVTGADKSPLAITVAADQAARQGLDAEWIVADVLEDALPDDFDVITCSLFLHHLQDEDVVRILRTMRDATDQGGEVRRLLICDLERSRMNLWLVRLAAHALSRSWMVHNDAVLSVRAAMTRQEFTSLVEVALDTQPQIKTLFPCRFIAEISLH